MKKNNVSIDFIAFGDLDPENTKKLEAFNENIKGGDGSHLEIIQPGPSLLSDHIISTPILAGEGVAPRGGDTGAGEEKTLVPEASISVSTPAQIQSSHLHCG